MIVNPNLSIHTIKIVPRYIVSNALTLTITDSTLGTTTDVTPASTMGGDYKLSLVFSYKFLDEKSYKLRLTDDVTTEIVYRGLVIATTQVAQKYKQTAKRYTY